MTTIPEKPRFEHCPQARMTLHAFRTRDGSRIFTCAACRKTVYQAVDDGGADRLCYVCRWRADTASRLHETAERIRAEEAQYDQLGAADRVYAWVCVALVVALAVAMLAIGG